ncbi:DUF5934 domain-containing protein [Burkholderia glumae]|uniref:TraC family protein n=1 Tax=Burkholderia glumae TaxID=337 RepID=UPI002150814F|nr:DUF5934 domain-containing protein [Burkholderia glumae]
MTLDQNASKPGRCAARAAKTQSQRWRRCNRTRVAGADWRAVGLQLESGGSICELYHTLTLFAREQIGRCVAAARGIWRSERFKLFPMVTQQLTTFLSAMPMALTPDLRDDLNKMRLISTKTTSMRPIWRLWLRNGPGQAAHRI